MNDKTKQIDELTEAQAKSVLQKIASGDDWFDIESAPKEFVSGSCFHGDWVFMKDDCEVDVARWTTEYPCSKGVWMRNYEPTDYIANINYFYKPTHWKHIDGAKHVQMLMEREQDDAKTND